MEKTTTRSTLSEAVFKNVGLSRNESATLVDSVFGEILKSLINGDDVKISSFGTFVVRQKKKELEETRRLDKRYQSQPEVL